MATDSEPKPRRVIHRTKIHEITPAPPSDATLVRQRWIPRPRREWAQQCADIMRRYGVVEGAAVYEQRRAARKHAQSLMKLLVDLRIFEYYQVIEHTERRGSGWAWSVEYDPTGENKPRRGANGNRRSGTVPS